MKITFNFMYKIFLFDLGLNMKKRQVCFWTLRVMTSQTERVLAHPQWWKIERLHAHWNPLSRIAEWFSRTTEWWALFSVLLSELHLHFFYASLISCLHLHHWCLPFHILLNFACRACLLWSTSCATWWCGAAGGPPSPSSPRPPPCCSASGPPSSSSAAP